MKRKIFKVLFTLNILVVFLFFTYYINLKYEKYYDYNIKYIINSKVRINKKIIYIDKINLSKEVVKADKNFGNLKNNLVYYNDFNVNNKIIIFGHSGNGHNAYFKDLYKLSIDDEVIIYDNGKEYKYILVNKYLIDEYDNYILKEEENSKKMLLVTCDNIDDSKRLVIELVKTL